MPVIITVPRLLAAVSAILLMTAASPASAYLGPGVGLGALGVALGIVGSVILGIFSILWYPFKRLIRKFRRQVTALRTPSLPSKPDSE